MSRVGDDACPDTSSLRMNVYERPARKQKLRDIASPVPTVHDVYCTLVSPTGSSMPTPQSAAPVTSSFPARIVTVAVFQMSAPMRL